MGDRYIIFGVRPEDELFNEIHTNDWVHAIQLAAMNSCEGFKARIWDNIHSHFVDQRVIDRAERLLNK